MKKAMVIGGLGNIGLGVTKELLRQGYDVSVMALPGTVEYPMPNATIIEIDRRDTESFAKKMRADKYEYVVDLACFSAEAAQADFEAFPEVKHLVVASSGAAYGALLGRELPIRENYALAPTWQYGIDKKAMEDTFMEHYRKDGFPVTIFRPTVTYGKQKTIVRQIASDNSWIDRIRKGKPIVVGNPYILRNFLHVDDAAGALANVFRHPVCKGQAYNMCGLKPYDWGTYHKTMMEVLGRETEMIEVPLQVLQACPSLEVTEMITSNFVYNGFYSGEKIARDIPEFCAQTDLKTGLAQTVEELDRVGLVPDSDTLHWEDDLIAAQRKALTYWQEK